MKYENYTAETIHKVGYTVIDNQVNVRNDKVYLVLKDNAGNMISAYLAPSEYKKITMPTAPMPLPKRWFIVRCVPESGDNKEEYFKLTIQDTDKYKTRDTLPAAIGDSVKVKGFLGDHTVVYVNRDVLVITSTVFAEQYCRGKLQVPTKIIFWDDFQSKSNNA